MRRHPGVRSHRVAVLDGITSPGAARFAAQTEPITGLPSDQPEAMRRAQRRLPIASQSQLVLGAEPALRLDIRPGGQGVPNRSLRISSGEAKASRTSGAPQFSRGSAAHRARQTRLPTSRFAAPASPPSSEHCFADPPRISCNGSLTRQARSGSHGGGAVVTDPGGIAATGNDHRKEWSSEC